MKKSNLKWAASRTKSILEVMDGKNRSYSCILSITLLLSIPYTGRSQYVQYQWSKNDSSKFHFTPISLPLLKMKVSSSFGMRIHPLTGKTDFHQGIDLAAIKEIVFSILKGRVSEIGCNSVFGNYIRISSLNLVYSYGHLSRVFVSKGQNVVEGQVIGITGSSGKVTGPHLHLSIQLNGTYINPLLLMLQATRSPTYLVTN